MEQKLRDTKKSKERQMRESIEGPALIDEKGREINNPVPLVIELDPEVPASLKEQIARLDPDRFVTQEPHEEEPPDHEQNFDIPEGPQPAATVYEMYEEEMEMKKEYSDGIAAEQQLLEKIRSGEYTVVDTASAADQNEPQPNANAGTKDDER